MDTTNVILRYRIQIYNDENIYADKSRKKNMKNGHKLKENMNGRNMAQSTNGHNKRIINTKEKYKD